MNDLINSKFRKDIIDHDTWKELYRVHVETRSTIINMLLLQP